MNTIPDISFREIETRPNPSHSVIWLHGLGADGSDFAPIVEALGIHRNQGIRFIFPDAPHRSVTCNGGYVMRAWYDIISLAPESREIDEAGLLESVNLVRQLIRRESERGISSDRVFLAGFSQGGAVAYSTALTHPEPLAGLIALSTYLPSSEFIARKPGLTHPHLEIFAAHGINDNVVSLALGEQALKVIKSLGHLPEWQTYRMEHEVCLEEIEAISKWLQIRITSIGTPSPCSSSLIQPYCSVSPYRTKDGSEIRELMHPKIHNCQKQSLAEARIPPNQRTILHRHLTTEELYHITQGEGLMRLGDEEFPVRTGDTVCIPPGTPHCITAQGNSELVLLCSCSPAYDHTDTELLESAA